MPVRRTPRAGMRWCYAAQVMYVPLKLPLDSARHAPGTERGYSFYRLKTPKIIDY